MSKAKFTNTRGNQGQSTTNAATFTLGEMAEVYGWRDTPHPAARRQAPTTSRARESSLGQMEPGRMSDFLDGLRDGRDNRARTALTMVGVYAGVRLLQKHWSSWKQHL